MNKFYTKDNNEKFYTNLIKIDENDFIEKILSTQNKNIGFFELEEKQYMNKNGKIDYVGLNSEIKNRIKSILRIKDDESSLYIQIKYKKITLNKKIYVFFISDSLNNSVEDIIKHLEKNIRNNNNIKFEIANIIFQLLLKIEIINIGSIELFSSNELNEDLRFNLDSNQKGDKVFYKTLRSNILIKNGFIASELISEGFLADNYDNEKYKLLLINKNLKKVSNKKVSVNFLETKASKQKQTKIYYYQLLDTIIKENVLKKLDIKYENHYFKLNYIVKGKNKLVSNILDKDYLDTVIITDVDINNLENEEKIIYNNIIYYLCKNSSDTIFNSLHLNKKEYNEYLNHCKGKNKKNHNLNITEIIESKNFKKEDLKKGVNYLIINIENQKNESSFKINNQYTADIKTTLDLFKNKYFNNKNDTYDFYTNLKLFNLNNNSLYTMQGIDINFENLKKENDVNSNYMNPYNSLHNLIKKVNDELIIKSYSKSKIILLRDSENKQIKVFDNNYKLFYFLKKKDYRENLYFAIVFDISFKDSNIIINSKEIYLPHSEQDLKNNLNSFIEKYPYLNINDLAQIRNGSFYVYSETDQLLIHKYSTIMVPRLIGNENDKLFNNDLLTKEGHTFSKGKESVFKGTIIKAIDKGAGLYIHLNGYYIDVKYAETNGINEKAVKDNKIQRIEIFKNGERVLLDLEDVNMINYFSTFTYHLIKMNATSKKNLLEKICDIELNN